ncbi:MAG: hypothetical protein GY856_26655 [bacterium]|nr:hypothetical protein [bacterium]
MTLERSSWRGVRPAEQRRRLTAYLNADRERGFNLAAPPEETRTLLKEVHKAYRTRINDVLLAALVQAVGEWTGKPTLLVEMEGHGREEFDEELDLSRTVGWFTSIFPVLLEGIDDPGGLLKGVKERLRSIPGGGVGYGLLRYLNEETAKRLRDLPPAAVVFNYLGQLDAALPPSFALRPAVESAGSAIGTEGQRRYLLEINGGVADGCLRLTWTYSENLHRRATIEALAAGFLEALRGLIRHCLSPGDRPFPRPPDALYPGADREPAVPLPLDLPPADPRRLVGAAGAGRGLCLEPGPAWGRRAAAAGTARFSGVHRLDRKAGSAGGGGVLAAAARRVRGGHLPGRGAAWRRRAGRRPLRQMARTGAAGAAGGPGAAPAFDPQHRGSGGLGPAPQPLQRRAGGVLRHGGGGPSPGARGHRVDGGAVHQRPAGAGAPCARGARERLAGRAPGRPGGAAPVRVLRAGADPTLARLAVESASLPEPVHLRELPRGRLGGPGA